MTDPAAPAPPIVPAGRPLGEAAAWVGHACWAELRLHQVLTGWLAVEADEPQRLAWWRLRSHRAELAEAWHRRLPELAELPRPDLVVPGAPPVVEELDGLVALDAPAATGERVAGLAAALAERARGYRAHVTVAVGPADGPVAATLAVAVARTEADLDALDGGPVRSP